MLRRPKGYVSLGSMPACLPKPETGAAPDLAALYRLASHRVVCQYTYIYIYIYIYTCIYTYIYMLQICIYIILSSYIYTGLCLYEWIPYQTIYKFRIVSSSIKRVEHKPQESWCSCSSSACRRDPKLIEHATTRAKLMCYAYQATMAFIESRLAVVVHNSKFKRCQNVLWILPRKQSQKFDLLNVH